MRSQEPNPSTSVTASPGRLATRRDWGRGAHYLAALATAFTALLALAALLTAAPAQALPNACPQNEAIRVEQHATFLPDCRAYEQVSPTDKSGGLGGVFPLGTLTRSEQYGQPMQSSPDGGAFFYEGEDFYQPLFGETDQYLSQRGTGAWSTANLTPASAGESATYVGLSPDLSLGVLSLGRRTQLSEEAPPGYRNLYLTRGAGFQPLITLAPPHRTPQTFGSAFHHEFSGEPDTQGLLFAGGNTGTPSVAAFSHLLFQANDALPTSEGNQALDGGQFENNLYEWSAGQLHLVNVLPDGEPDPNASFGIDYHQAYSAVDLPSLSHVISADGARIFWTDQNNGNLYLRENADRAQSPLDGEGNCQVPTDACTIQVDSSVGGGGQFQTASTDGTRVFFTKGEHLYRYDTTSQTTTDLAAGGVQGMLGADEGGSYAYFVSTSALTAGAIAGQPNLYLSYENQLSLIATLSPADDETPHVTSGGGQPQGDWNLTFAGRTAEVSPSGRYLAFMARENLTGYEPLSAGGQRDYEVYLYDAAAHQLACASCNTDGTPPTESTFLPPPVNGIYQQRYLTDSGRLFFSTADAVLPQDTNAGSDLYEYENGHPHLLSPGAAAGVAVFADASQSGDDVFFTTRQQLLPSDRDQIIDLYDARSGGGVLEEQPTTCGGETCLPSSPQPRPSSPPASNGPPGRGNPPPRRRKHHHHKPRRSKHSHDRTVPAHRRGAPR